MSAQLDSVVWRQVRRLARLSMLNAALSTFSWAQDAVHAPQDVPASRALDGRGFRTAFESAFAEEDRAAISALVGENPTLWAALFETYCRIWIERPSDAGEREERSLARAQALADAVDEVLEAPGLIEMWQAVDGWDEDQRERCRLALRDLDRGAGSREWEPAVALVSAAEATFRELGWSLGEARAVALLSERYAARAQYDLAQRCDRRGLEIHEHNGSPREIMRSLVNLGASLGSSGEQDLALPLFERALALAQKYGSKREIAHCLNQLGVCQTALGLLDQASERLRSAVRLSDTLGEPSVTAGCLSSLGTCLLDLGQHQRAIEAFERARELRVKIGDLAGLAGCLSSLANCHSALGNLDRAIELLEQVLSMEERIPNPEIINKALNNLGECYGRRGQYEHAIAYGERSLRLAQELGIRSDIGIALTNLGACHFGLGRYPEARGFHQRALAVFDQLGDPRLQASCLESLGMTELGLDDARKALGYFVGAAKAVTRLSRRRLSEAERGQTVTEWDLLPQRISECAVLTDREPDRALALRALESLLARALLEGLQERASGVLARAEPELLARRDAVWRTLERLRLSAARGVASDAADDRFEELRAGIAASEQELDQLEEELRQRNPALGELTAPIVATLDELREHAIEKDEALLRFVVAEEQSYLWVVTDEAVNVFVLPGTHALRETVNRLLKSLVDPTAQPRDFIEPAREVFRLVLAPAWECLAPKSQLVIVPGGILGFLPFDVLLTQDVAAGDPGRIAELPFLLREKTLRYAPSFSFLVFIAQSPKRERRWQKDLLLLGDPTYEVQATPQDTLAKRGIAWMTADGAAPRLPGTRDEVQRIASQFVERSEAETLFALRDMERSGEIRGNRFDLSFGSAASASRLLQDLTPYRIVHLATHGYFDSEYPWFSGLILSGGSQSADSFLSLPEIARLKLDAEVVFLSACETAKGTLSRSEGILNTARSFLLAGAQATIATQWKVFDQAAPVVARTFYQHLFSGLSPARSLRQAKLALALEEVSVRGAIPVSSASAETESARFAHPSAWAPFMLYGK